jgi:hypothetical protein
VSDTKTQTSVEAELRAAAAKLRANLDRPADELVADLLEHIAFDMECGDAEERDFLDHVPQFQRMVADVRGVDRMDWTAALAVARALNGTASLVSGVHGSGGDGSGSRLVSPLSHE